jgi:hypothetical protein
VPTHSDQPVHRQVPGSTEKLRRKIARACAEMDAMSSKTQETIAASREAMIKADAALGKRKEIYPP